MPNDVNMLDRRYHHIYLYMYVALGSWLGFHLRWEPTFVSLVSHADDILQFFSTN